MKYRFLLTISIAVILTSCSTAYKTGQTPDDVYYSPVKEVVAKNEDKEDDKKDKYEEYTSAEDRYLKMKTRNRDRWQTLDDYEYWNDTRYQYYSYNTYRNNWYNWYIWNTWSNPYVSVGYSNHCCCYSPYNNIKTGYIAYPIKTTRTTKPNLNSYTNTKYSNTNNQSLGNTLKKVFSSDNNNYNNSNRGSSSGSGRSYSPSSSGSSSSGSGRSGGGISRPGRN